MECAARGPAIRSRKTTVGHPIMARTAGPPCGGTAPSGSSEPDGSASTAQKRREVEHGGGPDRFRRRRRLAVCPPRLCIRAHRRFVKRVAHLLVATRCTDAVEHYNPADR